MLFFFHFAAISRRPGFRWRKSRPGAIVSNGMVCRVAVNARRSSFISFGPNAFRSSEAGRSLPMTLTTLAIMAVGAWLPYSPFALSLGFVPLPPAYWLWIGSFLLVYSVLTHKVKVWFHKRYGDD